MLKDLVISANGYCLELLMHDIRWSPEQQDERIRWHKARHHEMIEGVVSWMGLDFIVHDGVFRPYIDSIPPTRQIKKEYQNWEKVLDLGGGSGNIAVLLAKLGCYVTSIDVSEVAVNTIRENVEIHDVADKVDAICCDVSDVDYSDFDAAVGNPPFCDEIVSNLIERTTWDPRLGTYRSIFEKAGDIPIYLAYANFAPVLKLLEIAGSFGYRAELCKILRASEVMADRERLGLMGDYGVFDKREKDKRVFYWFRFEKR